ncbi:Peptidase S8/S53 domain-containing protein [Desulfonema limicola]|uniref:Peptidase S8/S53 domain-containing protein n=1 Tax=Desulfonema limicola TaxID=45656 RepID=A0A975B8S3_9BACT|nr:S8 family serine peptidase [Desulfonema limicola]QTA80875.1 Peptidase S8/S53 domain-containing protein [Desulfonema limicola]
MIYHTDQKKLALLFRIPPFSVDNVVLSTSEVIDWGLSMLEIPYLWSQTNGEGIKVAVLDTGIAFQHTDFRGAIIDSVDFTDSPAGASDLNGHGTHVAGIIAARKDSRGVVGVAPLSSLLIAKVLGDDGYGRESWVADGIRWAVQKGAHIISMSMGAPGYSRMIHDAIREAVAVNVFVICAAGNNGSRIGAVDCPGRFPETIAVGSIDRRQEISSFSSIGMQVDIVAPGDRILSTYPPNTFSTISGTSMATPFVSGVAALMLAKHRDFGGETPIRNSIDLRNHLRKTAVDLGHLGKDPVFGFGLINPVSMVGDVDSNGDGGQTSNTRVQIEPNLGLPDNPNRGMIHAQRVEKRGKVDHLSVWFSIEHPNISDLQVILISPDDRQIVLFDRTEDGKDLDFVHNSFDNPHLAAFKNADINGDWKLKITDFVPGNRGILKKWGLDIAFTP